MAWGGFTPASPLVTVKSDGQEAAEAPAAEEAAAPELPAVVADEPDVADADALPVTIDSTLKQMQAFAAEHPELGPILGRSKAAFLENLTAAWRNKLAEQPAAAPEPEAPVQEAEELPMTMCNTLKEMQAFAAARPELGEIQGRTKATFFASLTEAWSNSKNAEAAAEPVSEEVEVEVEVQGATELPVTMTSTLKAMQAFAAEHPELGEIDGKTKAAFFAILTEAWNNRGYTEATLPVSPASTLKEMQQFAEDHSASIGDMPKKSVAKAVFFDDLMARIRASGLLR